MRVAVEHPPLQSAGALRADAHRGHQPVRVDTDSGAGKHKRDQQQ